MKPILIFFLKMMLSPIKFKYALDEGRDPGKNGRLRQNYQNKVQMKYRDLSLIVSA
jgi:hypothetical protein